MKRRPANPPTDRRSRQCLTKPPPNPSAETPPETPHGASPQIDDECWDALLLDDDYEPPPEPGDFWVGPEAT